MRPACFYEDRWPYITLHWPTEMKQHTSATLS